ncbi:MAG: hypothetical protein ACREGC_01420, partial [Minisyncoccia bacterium]
MAKKFFEDMVREKRERKGSPVGGSPPPPIRNEVKEPLREKETIEDAINYSKPNPKRSRYLLWSIAFFSVAFCVFAISFLFARASVKINPKTADVVLNENLSAQKDSSSGGLSFDLMSIPGEETKSVTVNGEKDVAIPATGTVIIYNSYSSASQLLAIDTRLEGSNGKIYKTNAKITVPGKASDGTPGSIEVGIYASEAGAAYNSGPLDFTIVGFKGTPKYNAFQGRSKTDTSITGGYAGKAPAITDADKETAITDLKNSLQAKLLEQATNQIPPGFVLFKDATFLSADVQDIPLNAENGSVPITVKGTMYGLIFNEQSLTKKIAGDNLDGYDGSDIYISNIDGLKFSMANAGDVSFSDLSDINFNLSGPAKIVWRLDVDKFTADLLGRSKNDFNKILSNYPNID